MAGTGGAAPGGGGRGAMPTLFLSFAAAAAAAEAYFKPSAGRAGTVAGFMEALLEGAPLLIVGSGVCSVASVGRGDLSCVDGRRPPAALTLSATVRGFPPGMLPDRLSTSIGSS